MERTTKVFPLDDTPKALKNQGFSGKPFQSGHSFSSQARYDHFDTSPQYNYSVLGTDNMISSQGRYNHFDTAAYIVSPHRRKNCFWKTVSKSLAFQKTFPLLPAREAPPHAGLRVLPGEWTVRISSQPRYDHFDTAARHNLPY